MLLNARALGYSGLRMGSRLRFYVFGVRVWGLRLGL